MPELFGRYLPPGILSRIRSSLARQIRQDFVRWKCYAPTKAEARRIYHSVRAMIFNGHYQRAAGAMRRHGVPHIGDRSFP